MEQCVSEWEVSCISVDILLPLLRIEVAEYP